MDYLITTIIGLVIFLVVILLIKFGLGMVKIAENEVGLIVRKLRFDGRKLPDGAIVALNEEPGYQARTLSPGLHFWYWPIMYKIETVKVIEIKEGQIGQVIARDGKPQPKDRILSQAVECNMFQDAQAFLRNGGQKGKQTLVLTTGLYRINKVLFEVQLAPVTLIESDKVGILTTTDGHHLTAGSMAAPSVNGHSNYQDPDAFYNNGGCRGLQEQVLLAGQYNLNPWFVQAEQRDLISVPIGYVGVVVSYVGSDEKDISGDSFTHGNIVAKGGKGVWAEPLYPGKHPLNTRIMKVEQVPTTNIVLNWATARSEAHKLDEKLSTITVRSSDGFTFNLDVSQIINIGAKEAPYVISRVGSVSNLVNQVLEPIIGNYFRNSSQKYSVLDFLTHRSERQKEASEEITKAIKEYNVESVDTLIGDITPPEALMKPLTDRKVAEEQQKTYQIQKITQDTRSSLVAATALAEKQAELINAQQDIEVSKRKAQSVEAMADGQAKAARTIGMTQAELVSVSASREAEAIRSKGLAEADVLKVRGENEAYVIKVRGENEASVIEAKGLAAAKGAKENVLAMGDNYALMMIFEQLAKHNIKLVPDIIAGGGSDGSSAIINTLLLKVLSEGSKNGLVKH